jgi:hypothetical protein
VSHWHLAPNTYFFGIFQDDCKLICLPHWTVNSTGLVTGSASVLVSRERKIQARMEKCRESDSQVYQETSAFQPTGSLGKGV